METLTEREREVLTRYYAVDGRGRRTDLSLADVARSLGLSRERVRQIHDNGVAKAVKAYLYGGTAG